MTLLDVCPGVQQLPSARTMELWWLSPKSPGFRSVIDVLEQYIRPKAEIEIVKSAHGKPRLAADLELNFNVSHSSELTLMGVMREAVVGVDCEYVHDFDDVRGVSDLALTPRELVTIESAAERSRLKQFFALWTRKEAVVKAIGLGLQIPLNSFDVSAPNLGDPIETSVPSHGTWWVMSVDAPHGFVAACASSTPFDTRLHQGWELADDRSVDLKSH